MIRYAEMAKKKSSDKKQKRYEDRPDDKKGEPALPISNLFRNLVFKPIFKYTMTSYIMRTIDSPLTVHYLKDINDSLKNKRPFIGFEMVDFSDKGVNAGGRANNENINQLNDMLDEICTVVLPILSRIINKYSRSFTKKSLK